MRKHVTPVKKNVVTKFLPDNLDLLYHLAHAWHPILPESIRRVTDVDDLAMEFAVQVVRRSIKYDANKGAVTTFITVVCNSYAKDLIGSAARRPNVVLSIDEHVFLGPTITRVPREPRFLSQVQNFHLSLPSDLFEFVEDLLGGRLYRRMRMKKGGKFQIMAARLRERVEESGLPIDAYLAAMAEEMMPCDVTNAAESSV